VTGVGQRSIQGDIAFAQSLEQMGAVVRSGDDWIEASAGDALRGIVLDCTAIPDAAMDARRGSRCSPRGPDNAHGPSRAGASRKPIASLQWPTSSQGRRACRNRCPIASRACRPRGFTAATIDTYDDHRMAMCFSLVAFGGARIQINDPGCVSKTFPGYFDAFRSIVQSRP
jgi:3-phosphoshikimate 1-carboxyvinyltransferase